MSRSREEAQRDNSASILNVRMKQDNTSRFIFALTTGLVLLAANASLATDRALPGNSHAFGQTLAEGQDIYLRWIFGDMTVPSDANGNAVVENVVFLPFLFPDAPGLPASMDITMTTGQAFTMTLWGFVGYSYTDGTPPDAFLPLSLFQTAELRLSLDGVPLVTSENSGEFFTQFAFRPPLDQGSYSIIWFQGFGVIHTPLGPGNHILKLDAKNKQPVPPNFGDPVFELHNTWNITVNAGR